MGDVNMSELIDKAYAYLTEKIHAANAKYNIGAYERYDWDQEKGELIWSDNGEPKVIADIQFVGSVSLVDKSWLWSWGNPSILEPMYKDILTVKEFGEENKLEKLTNKKWPAEEVDGWEMTAIASYVLQSECSYRSPDEKGFSFLLLNNLRFAD